MSQIADTCRTASGAPKPLLIARTPQIHCSYDPKQRVELLDEAREKRSAYVAPPPNLVNPRLLAGSPAAAGRRHVHPRTPSSSNYSVGLAYTTSKAHTATAPEISGRSTAAASAAAPPATGERGERRRGNAEAKRGVVGTDGRRSSLAGGVRLAGGYTLARALSSVGMETGERTVASCLTRPFRIRCAALGGSR
jgi:hypothetical protein